MAETTMNSLMRKTKKELGEIILANEAKLKEANAKVDVTVKANDELRKGCEGICETNKELNKTIETQNVKIDVLKNDLVELKNKYDNLVLENDATTKRNTELHVICEKYKQTAANVRVQHDELVTETLKFKDRYIKLENSNISKNIIIIALMFIAIIELACIVF